MLFRSGLKSRAKGHVLAVGPHRLVVRSRLGEVFSALISTKLGGCVSALLVIHQRTRDANEAQSQGKRDDDPLVDQETQSNQHDQKGSEEEGPKVHTLAAMLLLEDGHRGGNAFKGTTDVSRANDFGGTTNHGEQARV